MQVTLELIYKKLVDIENKVISLDQRVDRLEQRMDNLEQRMDKLEQRMDKLEQRMDKLETELSEFKAVEQTHFEIVTDWFHALKTEFGLKYDSLNLRVNENTEKIATLTATAAMHTNKLIDIESTVINLANSFSTESVTKTDLKNFAALNTLEYYLN